MKLEVIQIITSLTGSIGFSLIFGLRGKQLPVAAIGAGFTWGIYLIAEACGSGLFFANVLASIFAGIYTVVFSHVLKVPKTVLTFSVVVSLIPGRALYNTMKYAMSGEWLEFAQSGMTTISVAAAIAIGITVVLVGAQLTGKLKLPIKERRQK